MTTTVTSTLLEHGGTPEPAPIGARLADGQVERKGGPVHRVQGGTCRSRYAGSGRVARTPLLR